MKGSISLDFAVAVLIIVVLAASILGFVYLQEERVAKASIKLSVELLATSIGSAINRFVSTKPDSGSELIITPRDIKRDIPFADLLFSSFNCTYVVKNGFVNVTVEYTGRDTGKVDHVSASYPIFSNSIITGKKLCNESFTYP